MRTTFFRTNKSYLPHFSRIFTERPLAFILPGLFCGILASLLLLKPFIFANNPKTTLPLIPNKQRSTYVQSYETWKEIIAEKPEYRDGYVMLAYYAQEIGKTDEAKEYLQRVLSLDPNYQIPEVFSMEE